jgi:hypothetical protein
LNQTKNITVERSQRSTFSKKMILFTVMTDLTQEAAILGGAFLIPEDDKFLHNQRLG